jgi:hypothetical protein
MIPTQEGEGGRGTKSQKIEAISMALRSGKENLF